LLNQPPNFVQKYYFLVELLINIDNKMLSRRCGVKEKLVGCFYAKQPFSPK